MTFYFIDRTSPAWTVLSHDSFDDGTTQGWSGYYVQASTTYYRSFRYSLASPKPGLSTGTAYYTKTFYVPPQYNESYLILAMRNDNWDEDYPAIYLDSTLYFRPDTTPSNDIWYQFVVPLHAGTTNVKIETFSGRSYMDDVYVILK